ncbi:hypothetical protein ACLMJK_002525 [Lecanora helva]
MAGIVHRFVQSMDTFTQNQMLDNPELAMDICNFPPSEEMAKAMCYVHEPAPYVVFPFLVIIQIFVGLCFLAICFNIVAIIFKTTYTIVETLGDAVEGVFAKLSGWIAKASDSSQDYMQKIRVPGPDGPITPQSPSVRRDSGVDETDPDRAALLQSLIHFSKFGYSPENRRRLASNGLQRDL